MEKKPKYTLFPISPSSPSRTPLPPLPEDDANVAAPQPPGIPLPPRRKSSVLDLDPYLLLPRQTSALQSTTTAPARLRPTAPPTLRNPFALQTRSISALHPPRIHSPISEEPPHNLSRISEEKAPLSPVLVSPPEMLRSPSSSTSSAGSFHKPSPATSPPSGTPPRTVYFHTGLGGAGNYRKAIREDNILRATVPGQHQPPRFLAGLFGSKKKGRREKYARGVEGERVCEQGSLGVAEVMRRKLVSLSGEGKTGTNRA